MIQGEPCPFCNQTIHGMIPDRRVPRIRAKLLISLKEEIYSNLGSHTSWGRNQLKDMLDTIFDARLEDV